MAEYEDECSHAARHLPVAQRTERLAPNEEATGSIPVGETTAHLLFDEIGSSGPEAPSALIEKEPREGDRLDEELAR